MKEAFGAEVELVGGGGGIYDVVVDGAEIFSKHKLDRFPEDGEIVRLIQERGDGD